MAVPTVEQNGHRALARRRKRIAKSRGKIQQKIKDLLLASGIDDRTATKRMPPEPFKRLISYLGLTSIVSQSGGSAARARIRPVCTETLPGDLTSCQARIRKGLHKAGDPYTVKLTRQGSDLYGMVRCLLYDRATRQPLPKPQTLTLRPRKMISAEYCRLMARYNRWQNTSLITASDGLTEAERWMDRGAFFKSIAATLNHLYWADALMLERIKGNERPQDTITHSLVSPSDWSEYKELRVQRDVEIEEWAADIATPGPDDIIKWYPPDGSARIEMPKAICIVQLFNHQTHHRGQIHAMLTGMGAKPEPTDIPAMP